MSQEYAVATTDQVPEGQHIVVKVRGREIGVFNIQGRYYALPNVCIHQNGPLCRGAVSGTVLNNADTGWKHAWALQGEVVVCPWHSLEFHITDGQCLAYPKRKLPTWPVKVEGTQISVVM